MSSKWDKQLGESLGQRFVGVIEDAWGDITVVISSVAGVEPAVDVEDTRQKILNIVPPNRVLRIVREDALEDSSQSTNLSDAPLWPESLRRGELMGAKIPYRSSAPDASKSPVIVAFYSLRGGVGRSTALVQTAWRLYDEGARVICVDMDVEAPGLASIFGVEDQIPADRGVVPLLNHLDAGAGAQAAAEHLWSVTDDDRLRLLPAGVPTADYAYMLNAVEPAAWYNEEENPFRALFDGLRSAYPQPDVILVDCRTGISAISAPILFDIAQVSIICFYPHPQARAGTGALVRALIARSEFGGTSPVLRFVVSPIPALEELQSKYEERATEWISDWLGPAVDADGRPAFDNLDEVIQLIPYSEARAGSDRVSSRSVAEDGYDAIAGWLSSYLGERDIPVGLDGNASQRSRLDVLNSLQFSAGTAESELESLPRTFLRTDIVGEALRPDRALVLGRKGSGKTAIFTLLKRDANAIVVTGSPSAASPLWIPDSNVYQAVDRV